MPSLTLTNPGTQNSYDGDSLGFFLVATEFPRHTLTYSLSSAPAGVSVNAASGFVSGSIDDGDDTDSPYSVTATVEDTVTLQSASQTFSWFISQPSVTLTTPGDQSNYDGDVISLSLSASDSASHALTYSASDLPSGLSVNSSTGVISGTIASDADASGPYSVTAADSAAEVSASQTFSWAIAQPTVTVANPLDHDNLDADSVSFGVWATDTASHSLSYSATGLPSGISINSSTGVISGTLGATADADGPYSVTVTASDSAADVSADTTFSWEVDPLVTVLSPGNQTNCEGDTVALAVQATDAAGGTLTYTASGLPAGLSIDSSTGAISGIVSSGDGADSPYSVTVTAADGSADVSVSQSFTWSIVPINIVNPGPQSNLDGDAVSLDLHGSVSYAATDTFAYSASGLPAGLSLSGGVISGSIADDADTSSPYSVTVTYTDVTADISASQIFTWCVHAPSASDQTLNTTPNTAITEIDLTQSTNEMDDPSMAVVIASGPSHGTLTENGDGTYTYTPASGFTGTDGFTFYAAVGDPVDSNTSTVTINVAADTPALGGDLSYADLPGQALTLDDLVTNGSDPDGHALTAIIESGPSNGTVALNSSGVYVYTPNTGFTGSDSFTYELSNGWHASSTATVSIDVSSANPLIASTVTQQAAENQPLTIAPASLLTKDMSATSGSISLCSFSQPTNGSLSVDRSGNLVYTPANGYTGADSFTCLITDGTNLATETVDLEVGGVGGGLSFVQAPAIPGAALVPVATIRAVRAAAGANAGFTFTNGVVGMINPIDAEATRLVAATPNASRFSYNLNRAGTVADTGITATNLTDLETAVTAAITAQNPTATGITLTTFLTVTLGVNPVAGAGNAALRHVNENLTLLIDYSYVVGPTTFQGQVLVMQTARPFELVVNVNNSSSRPINR